MANLSNLIVRGLSRLGNVVASKVTATEFVGNLTGNADTATNATKVNNHTVDSDVPSDAKFTDTTYTPASATPLMDGTATVGTSAKYAREDHVHPTDTSRVPTSRKVNGHALSADISITASDVSAIPSSQKGAASGVAELDSSGKVPSSQLPSFVDDVLEYASKSAFPSTGESGKIYVDTSTNLTYRWSGSAYVEISQSLALGETSSTAYRGDYGAAAYAHAVTNKGAAFSSGLYKITTNSEGHVTSASAVEKADITALGVPAQDTTYSLVGAQNTTGLIKNGSDVSDVSQMTPCPIVGGVPYYEPSQSSTELFLTATVISTNWSTDSTNGGYEQTVAAVGITTSMHPMIDIYHAPGTSATDWADQSEAYGTFGATGWAESGADIITLHCDEAIATNFLISIKV